MSRRKRTNGMVLRMDGVEGALYAEVEGKRVAKRFSRGRWISLEPGYVVRGGPATTTALPSNITPNSPTNNNRGCARPARCRSIPPAAPATRTEPICLVAI
jgi:hypothetical protein